MAGLNAVLALAQALAPLLGLLLIKLFAARDRAAGAADEAVKLTAASAPVEAAIAEAEADAPTTRQAVADRLKAGTF